MDIKDLSIGYWVQDKNGTYAQILGIENWSDGYVLNVRINGVDVGCVPASSAHPIPITPEILEKNGFVRAAIDNKIYTHSSDAEITLYNDGWWHTTNLDEYSLHKINGVHQLQHLLRLYGVDKEFEL